MAWLRDDPRLPRSPKTSGEAEVREIESGEIESGESGDWRRTRARGESRPISSNLGEL